MDLEVLVLPTFGQPHSRVLWGTRSWNPQGFLLQGSLQRGGALSQTSDIKIADSLAGQIAGNQAAFQKIVVCWKLTETNLFLHNFLVLVNQHLRCQPFFPHFKSCLSSYKTELLVFLLTPSLSCHFWHQHPPYHICTLFSMSPFFWPAHGSSFLPRWYFCIIFFYFYPCI